ncbi:MAG: RNA polymerase sigma factor [Ignavibacteria bacterium]|nr:RNA polymerase sigma factor [Bacteroidota bacterium]MSQ46752.1 RNA polymerase sigma factor [Ignavibacteria bacterium]
MTDEEILQRIAEGDEKAFSEFVEKYKGKAFSLLRSICKNNFDAEEALQDVFMKVMNYASTFRGDAKVSTWFYKITYHTGLKYSITRRKHKTEFLDEILESRDFGDEIKNEDSLEQDLILKLIAELSGKQSTVITLFYLNELSIEEIVETLKITESDVKTTLHRGRNNLYNIIKTRNLEKELK